MGCSQDHSGVWVSTCEIESDGGESIHKPYHAILDFISEDTLVMKRLTRKRPTKLHYSKNGNAYIAKQGGNDMRWTIVGNQLTMEIDGYSKMTVMFEKMEENGELNPKRFGQSAFNNQSFQFVDDVPYPLENEYSFKVDNEVIHNFWADEDFGDVKPKKWFSNTYKGYLFLVIEDDHDRSNLVTFYKESGDTYFGKNINVYTKDEYPYIFDSKAIKLSNPTQDEIAAIRKQLIGKWQDPNKPIVYSTDYGIDEINNQKFELELREDGQFNLLISGTVVKGNSSSDESQVYEGSWKLGPSGNYFVLEPYGFHDNIYVGIEQISENQLDLHHAIEALGGRFIKPRKVSLFRFD